MCLCCVRETERESIVCVFCKFVHIQRGGTKRWWWGKGVECLTAMAHLVDIFFFFFFFRHLVGVFSLLTESSVHFMIVLGTVA